MQTREIEYHNSDGRRFVGYLAAPDRPSGPAILLAHNAPGVGPFERNTAGRLAERGYVVFCADYVGDGRVLAGEEIGAALGPLLEDSSRVRPTMAADDSIESPAS